MLIALLLATSLGLAAKPLVFEGPVDPAIMRVAADAGLSEWNLQPQSLQSLLPRSGVVLLGADQPNACPNPSLTNTGLRDTVALAEKQILYHQEWEVARMGLVLAGQAMACLTEPLEASLASRIFFLRGFVELETGREPEAREAFDRAVIFAPTLEWDERFPPTGQPLLEAAREALAAASPGILVLGPGIPQAPSLWVDGQPARVEENRLHIKPGVHLVQILQPSVVTLPLHIVNDRVAAIVDAKAMAAVPLASLLGTIELQALMEQEFGPGTPVWFYAGENTWRLEDSWREIPKSDVVLHAERAIVGQKLARSGMGVLGVGMVGAAMSWTIIGSNYKTDASESRASYEARQARVDASAPWAYTTSGIALGGLAVAVTGWALLDGRVHLRPGSGGLPGVTLQAVVAGP